MIGEWSLRTWVEVFWMCHSIIDGSVVQWAWPDGGGLLQQQALTVSMMRMLRPEAQQWVNDKIKAEIAKAHG